MFGLVYLLDTYIHLLFVYFHFYFYLDMWENITKEEHIEVNDSKKMHGNK